MKTKEEIGKMEFSEILEKVRQKGIHGFMKAYPKVQLSMIGLVFPDEVWDRLDEVANTPSDDKLD